MRQSRQRIGVPKARATSGKRPRVIIVSDVVLYREGLGASLARDGRLEVLDLTGSAAALPVIGRTPPDAVLLDGNIADSLSLARRIRANASGIPIIGFGIAGEPDRLVACAESGLAAFVDNDGSFDELVVTVLDALNGEFACSPRISALMCERLANLASVGQRPETLTRREREIAVLIGEGLSNKEIANDLRIGPSTVKNHVHNILEKLNVRRRAAIVHQLQELPWMQRSLPVGSDS
jgi:two-component system, NarL family, nitrate/nitrite response regulator NarL